MHILCIFCSCIRPMDLLTNKKSEMKREHNCLFIPDTERAEKKDGMGNGSSHSKLTNQQVKK